jgi:hypothetical protein
MKDELRKEMMRSDEETAELTERMSREDQLAYFKKFYQMVMDDPQMSAALPPEQLKLVKDSIDALEQAFENERQADRNLATIDMNREMMKGKLDRLADEALERWADNKEH